MLEPFLIEAGALVAGDPRFSNRRVFSAAEHAGLLAEIPTLVSLRTIRREIGASRTEVERLVAEGCLTPRCRCETVRLRWSLTQAKELLSALQCRAAPIEAEDPAWETLLTASHRGGQSLSALLAAVKAGGAVDRRARPRLRRSAVAKGRDHPRGFRPARAADPRHGLRHFRRHQGQGPVPGADRGGPHPGHAVAAPEDGQRKFSSDQGRHRGVSPPFRHHPGSRLGNGAADSGVARGAETGGRDGFRA
ncbi:hypothetical protein ACTTAL_10900 [Rhodobacter capsulatus]